MTRYILYNFAGTLTGLALTTVMIIVISNAPWHYWSNAPWRSFMITFAALTPMMCALGGIGLDGYLRKWRRIDWDAVEVREQL